MKTSDTLKELATALNLFHQEVGKVKKDSTNPFFKSKYADLSTILDAIDLPLNNNGLMVIQLPEGKYGLTTRLMHISGEWIEETYYLEPVKPTPQDAGSVITYTRRYALGAVLSLNIDEDDDAEKGMNRNKEPENKQAENLTDKTLNNKPEIKNWLSETAYKTICDNLQSNDPELIEKAKRNFEGIKKPPYGMKKEYRTAIEVLIKELDAPY